MNGQHRNGPGDTTLDTLKLCYIGDDPVAKTSAGPLFFYRLFAQRPPGSLLIVEGGSRSRREDRLRDQCYTAFSQVSRRLLRTRAASFVAELNTAWAARVASTFGADAIVTVGLFSSWITAYRVAQWLDVPLFCIVHDDWPAHLAGRSWGRERVRRLFGNMYRHAAVRFCISAKMEAAFRNRYGVPGLVLPPPRAERDPGGNLQAVTPVGASWSGAGGRPFTVLFLGTIYTAGAQRALVDLVAALRAIDGRLVMVGKHNERSAAVCDHDTGRARHLGFLPYGDLAVLCREGVDAVFAPLSFEAADHWDLSFPSKIADYTTLGVPILIQGPPTCAAVDWAERNAGVADVVTERGSAAVERALRRLASDPDRCRALASTAATIGAEQFEPDAVSAIFSRAIARHVG